MTLEQFFLTAENRLFNLGWGPWLRHPHAPMRERSDQLVEDLQEHCLALEGHRSALADAKERFDECVLKSTMLALKVEASVFNKESDDAWRQALELDQSRRSADEERERVYRLNRKVRREEASIAQIENELARIQEKLYT
jgi:hypothetical protein